MNLIMPSFDAVSEIDWQEVRNATDQASRELRTRFDFRNVDSGFDLTDKTIVIHAEEEFQLDQLFEILKSKCINRKLDVKILNPGSIESSGKTRRQSISLVEGIDREASKAITKAIKDLNKKLQIQVQGDHLRVSGKKRDELQNAIACMKELDLPMPLQFKNFRD